MIVVRSTKGHPDQAPNRASNVPMQPVRSEGHGVTRGMAAVTGRSMASIAPLSRELSNQPFRLENRCFRTESVDERDDDIVGSNYARRPPVYARSVQQPSLMAHQPPQRSWTTQLSRGVPTDWRPSGVTDGRPRHMAQSWTTYQRPTSSYPRSWIHSEVRSHPNAPTQMRGTWPHFASAGDSSREQLVIPVPEVISLGRSETEENSSKRELNDSPVSVSTPVAKKTKGLDRLDLLCQATLEIGPLQDNPAGCSCPKSKCIALYCDCFKAGRRCDPRSCGCTDCKNTADESGVDGARTKAIRSILARNPRAFVMAGLGNAAQRPPPGELACNCIRSRCLKLYCTCFQKGKACKKDVCTCVGCQNFDDSEGGERQLAMQMCLEKRPDAFETRVREPGLGCACKNNRCVRKYCECFRTDLACTDKCSCRQCQNRVSLNLKD